MECKICEQPKHQLYCIKCVKEGVRRQDYQLMVISQKRDEAVDKVKDHLSSDSRQVWQLHAERDEKKVAIYAVRQEIERLQGLIRKERQRLENVKTDVATRKSNLASAIKGIKASYAAGSTNLKTELSRIKEKRENVHLNIAIARRSRCKEAADLLGLRRIPNKEDTFAIAGIVMVDFHAIRNYDPMYVILALSHVAHLLTLLTNYLSLKLPHEIIPPSRGIFHPCIRKSSSTKPLLLALPPDSSNPSSTSKAYFGKRLKDIPGIENLTEAMSLLAWDTAWVLWTQQLWPNSWTNEPLEACRVARNLYLLVNSPKIGRISHASTIEFIPTLETSGVLKPFTLTVKSVQDVISSALDENKSGDVDGGGWDMVEGGEEVLRGEGWLKLNSVA